MDDTDKEQFEDCLQQFSNRVTQWRHADKDRDNTIDRLVAMYQELNTKYKQKCVEYKESVKLYQEAQEKAKKYQRALNNHPFAAVILDGDGGVFRGDLLLEGEAGGREAATILHRAIQEQLRATYPDSNTDQWRISAYVALTMGGLSKVLIQRGILQSPEDLAAFFRGFVSREYFNVVDVGKGKERADYKCRESFEFSAQIPACKHIFFGPCHDAGPIPFLQKCTWGPPITLIETTPALKDFHKLKLPFADLEAFRRTPFSDIQGKRRISLPDKPINGHSASTAMRPPHATLVETCLVNGVKSTTSSAAAPPATTQPSSAPTADTRQTNGTKPCVASAIDNGPTSLSWSTVTRKGSQRNSTINISARKAAQRKHYLVNEQGQRVDERLPSRDPDAEKRLEKRKKQGGNLCNAFHLRPGTCKGCTFQHIDELPADEKLCLRHLARCLSCNTGRDCVDPDCLFSHNCRYGEKNCRSSACKFPHVDPTPVYRIYEDGTKERI